MAYLQLQDVRKQFGSTEVIHGVNLSIERGEFVVFVGPSGCGKSTLLRMIAGLESITSGALHLDGRDITRAASGERDLAMVFQSYALYPHMSVYDNMSFALKLAKVDPQIIRTKVTQAAETLNLTNYLKRTPKELSGGQRQRVAIGRAIVRAPKAFLFDEPLSNLDAALRGSTRVEILKLHRELGATTVYVTHDQIEAMTLADRVVVLRDGQIEQVGSPLELYDHPANRFVAQFIGQPAMNLLPAPDVPAFSSLTGGVLPADGFLGVRPEHVRVLASAPEGPRADGTPAVAGTVELVEALGSDTLIHTRVAGVTVIARQPERTQIRAGATVYVAVLPDALHCFDRQGIAVPLPSRRTGDAAGVAANA